mmetsp:Transcript_63090/g.149505  ORF Transcript_63090/g.149505 Transcript_63090/m.149505 type:complete len:85 (-) Transcript_63090:182-436(-)
MALLTPTRRLRGGCSGRTVWRSSSSSSSEGSDRDAVVGMAENYLPEVLLPFLQSLRWAMPSGHELTRRGVVHELLWVGGGDAAL